MQAILLRDRTATSTNAHLMGRMVTVLDDCADPTCTKMHPYGDFELAYRKNDDWLTIAPNNTLVWLPPKTWITTTDLPVSQHVLSPLQSKFSQCSTVGNVLGIINTMLEGSTVAPGPGAFWWHRQCPNCQKLRSEKTLWLDTIEEAREYVGGTFAAIPGLMSNLLARMVRAGDVSCQCS